MKYKMAKWKYRSYILTWEDRDSKLRYVHNNKFFLFDLYSRLEKKIT